MDVRREGVLLNISDSLAVISLLVAVLAAIYARWAWSEAKRANEISLHRNRKEIYDAFFGLKSHMAQYWDLADFSVVTLFCDHSHNAAFYFDKPLALELKNYYTLCFHIADKSRTHPDADARELLLKKARDAEKLAAKIEEKLFEVVTLV